MPDSWISVPSKTPQPDNKTAAFFNELKKIEMKLLKNTP